MAVVDDGIGAEMSAPRVEGVDVVVGRITLMSAPCMYQAGATSYHPVS